MSQQQVHAQHAAKVIRGQCEVFCSHRTVSMMSGLLMDFVGHQWPYETDDEAPDSGPAYIGIFLDKEGHLIH